MDRSEAEQIVRGYLSTQDELIVLGYGRQGYVFRTPRVTAVKVSEDRSAFHTELRVYQHFKESGVTSILGLAVPRLLGFDSHLKVLEMSLVQPPYALDFGGCQFDLDEDEFPGSYEEFEDKVRDAYDQLADRALEFFHYLRSVHGICYWDLAPRNVNFGDLRE